MPKKNVILWFRQDLRLADNPALNAALENGKLIPVFIWDEAAHAPHEPGAASKAWLHHSLNALKLSLKGNLRVFWGDSNKVLQQLCKETGAQEVFWNRSYEPAIMTRDASIEQGLSKAGIETRPCSASLLWEPWEVKKDDGSPYKIFTPFYRKAMMKGPSRRALGTPKLKFASLPPCGRETSIDALKLLPKYPWHQKLLLQGRAGEANARQSLEAFVHDGLDTYTSQRDRPALKATSNLSPHLHWGEVSPHQAWERVQYEGDNEDIEHFKRELAWREFSYYLLHHFPGLPTQNLKPKFDGFPWRKHAQHLKHWQQGQTGYPIIDAGMRELWQTGLMHNRVRMLVASFLVKNLMIDWRQGAAWFWDCLLDADLASNSAGWQWVAGSGCDAAPYFRIFNPITQGEKFDKEGDYTRRLVPELSKLPNKYLFRPWEAPAEVLDAAGVQLGKNYPRPIVDIKPSRIRALEAFKTLGGT